MSNSPKKYLDSEKLIELIDELFDEICIYDNNYRMIYINKACQRHYGFEPQDIIGRHLNIFENEGWWDRSILPHVYKDKKAYAIKQKTVTGAELFTIATPIFDTNGEILYVLMSVRDQVSESLIYTTPKKTFSQSAFDLKVNFIYESESMHNVFNLISRVSEVDSNCLLVGESGTGKTALAKYIHKISSRKKQPFISVNCASLPKDLIEAELFGYVKGAFTGAKSEGKKGLFEAANNGTLLLDEISELPYAAQAKLLHVIQEKEFLPVGSTKPVSVNVKIIAATNKDLLKLIENHEFRTDLYYRLNIFEITVPPLRQREKDIAKLATTFLHEFNKKYKRSHVLSQETINIFRSYAWKGNVRELRHTIERLTVIIDDMIISPQHLPKHLFSVNSSSLELDAFMHCSLDNAITQLERKMIITSHKKHRTTRGVAMDLSLSQTRASRLIRKYVRCMD